MRNETTIAETEFIETFDGVLVVKKEDCVHEVVLYGLAIALAVILSATSTAAAEVALDYDAYKSQVEPIFLKKRPGHARRYVCHVDSNNAFRLEKFSPGSIFWSEDQSGRNFRIVAALIVAGDPDKSRLLLQPLAPEAGGLAFHSGGRQFSSKDDPDWKIIAEWVRGQK